MYLVFFPRGSADRDFHTCTPTGPPVRSAPGQSNPETSLLDDQTLHIMFFFSLSWIGSVALTSARERPPTRVLLSAEGAQHPTNAGSPGNHPEPDRPDHARSPSWPSTPLWHVASLLVLCRRAALRAAAINSDHRGRRIDGDPLWWVVVGKPHRGLVPPVRGEAALASPPNRPRPARRMAQVELSRVVGDSSSGQPAGPPPKGADRDDGVVAACEHRKRLRRRAVLQHRHVARLKHGLLLAPGGVGRR